MRVKDREDEGKNNEDVNKAIQRYGREQTTFVRERGLVFLKKRKETFSFYFNCHNSSLDSETWKYLETPTNILKLGKTKFS